MGNEEDALEGEALSQVLRESHTAVHMWREVAVATDGFVKENDLSHHSEGIPLALASSSAWSQWMPLSVWIQLSKLSAIHPSLSSTG